MYSRVAQWKRAGPITQRSEDRNLALLDSTFHYLQYMIYQRSVIEKVMKTLLFAKLFFRNLLLYMEL